MMMMVMPTRDLPPSSPYDKLPLYHPPKSTAFQPRNWANECHQFLPLTPSSRPQSQGPGCHISPEAVIAKEYSVSKKKEKKKKKRKREALGLVFSRRNCNFGNTPHKSFRFFAMYSVTWTCESPHIKLLSFREESQKLLWRANGINSLPHVNPSFLYELKDFSCVNIYIYIKYVTKL